MQRTLIQATVLGGIGGPFCWVAFNHDSLAWCCFAMFLSPFIVNFVKPVCRKEYFHE